MRLTRTAVSLALAVLPLAALTATATVAPTAVSAKPLSLTPDPCGSYPEIVNTYLYDTNDTAWPWYGVAGFFSDWPVAENQTPAGQPGSGQGPYASYDICKLNSDQILIWANNNTWISASPGYLVGDNSYAGYTNASDVFDYACYGVHGVLLASNYLGRGVAHTEYAATGYQALAAWGAANDTFLIAGLC